jgi:hypothetical protein
MSADRRSQSAILASLALDTQELSELRKSLCVICFLSRALRAWARAQRGQRNMPPSISTETTSVSRVFHGEIGQVFRNALDGTSITGFIDRLRISIHRMKYFVANRLGDCLDQLITRWEMLICGASVDSRNIRYPGKSEGLLPRLLGSRASPSRSRLPMPRSASKPVGSLLSSIALAIFLRTCRCQSMQLAC